MITVETAVDPKAEVFRAQALTDLRLELFGELIDPTQLSRIEWDVVQMGVAHENVMLPTGDVYHSIIPFLTYCCRMSIHPQVDIGTTQTGNIAECRVRNGGALRILFLR